jgi:peptidoglycan/LPS O-acetylase OafA/YrhL
MSLTGKNGGGGPVNSSMQAPSRKTFETINFLRGVAAIAVLTGHYQDLFLPFAFSGLFAVDLFFAMSGFVIANSYEHRLRAGMSVWQFFKIRMARFYPLYICGTIIGFVLIGLRIVGGSDQGWTAGELLSSIVPSALMMPSPHVVSWGPAVLYPLNVVAWSLFFEMAINMLYAATWRFWTKRKLLIACPAAAVLLVGSIHHFHSIDTGWSPENFIGGLARTVYAFPVGVLAFRLYQVKQDFGILGFIACAVATGVLMLHLGWSPTAQAIVSVVVIPAILWVALSSQVRDLLARIARFFGDISYAVYAIHVPLIAALLVIPAKFGIRMDHFAPASGIGLLSILLGVCWVLDRADRRVREWLLSTSRECPRGLHGSPS